MKIIAEELYDAVRAEHLKGGKTLEQVGSIYGFSRQRVWQIVNNYDTN